MTPTTNKEVAEHIRKWVASKEYHGPFSWVTDGCTYEQHVRFVRHRNDNWNGGDFNAFCLDYADTLEKEEKSS